MKRTIPAVRWPGGKTRHLPTILPLIPEHRTYVEPFAGGLAVLLAKERSEVEVVNDTNKDLVAFYRNVRMHRAALLEELQLGINSREDFFAYLAQPGLTEIQRAARWYMINRMSWGANGTSFNSKRAVPVANESTINELHERLKRVVVENSDYSKLLARYDGPDTFYFIDPPYLHCDPTTYAAWDVTQMTELAARLAKLEGQWMVTVDDSRENREIFVTWNIQAIETKNALVSWKKTTPLKELLITPKRRAR